MYHRPVLRTLLAALLTGCATAAGAMPFLFVSGIDRRLYDTLLGLGAGLMLAAATLGLLPAALHDVRLGDSVDTMRLALVLLGFLLGMALLFLMDRLIPHLHAGGHHEHMEGDSDDPHGDCNHSTPMARARHQGLLVLGAMALHRLPEGFALGAAFATGILRPLGVTLTVAIAVQNSVEGAMMAAPLQRGGLKPARLIGLVSLTGMAVPAAALAGYYLPAHVSGSLPVVLALAAGALLYLTCNEIIPESHSHGNERRATFGLLAGFVLIILLQVFTGQE